MEPEDEVLFEQRGRLGLVTLNRPRAINALTHRMVQLIRPALARWAADESIATVAIVGAGERGLCAGGDIVSLYNDAVSGDGSASAEFWFDEYHLNSEIARFPKPIVAVQDGIVLGGGIGISAHASHRVVTERGRLGLPEVGIGFVPDVGATWLLSRASGEVGTFLALTAASVGAADAIEVGLSDVYIRSERIANLLAALEATDAGEAVMLLSEDPGAPPLHTTRSWIDEAFATHDVSEIIRRLRLSGIAEAGQAADAIVAKSPTALAVTRESLRRAAQLSSLEEALDQEYRVSLRMLKTHDFTEGVRAQVIDKDRNPRWEPAGDVDAAEIKAFFEPSDDRELGLAALTRTQGELRI
ncbi:3-hydroxyisobutyryl-CoA hydrolase [Microbacterium sp. CH12i]|uniref:enoyl-CoA hydratase/isomerase family protein n=1 Tax=Microbacterium sp. CH12i TaxID=1479651 RepID=UPI0004613EDE|nr:enoyl-CoA hydratase/isomerase family protein [Microbacterium sp. CH12i]KDA05331.1 3-hydroxyisobutyryl-CoA hydrolase [Microbacterium sp. CH12i]